MFPCVEHNASPIKIERKAGHWFRGPPFDDAINPVLVSAIDKRFERRIAGQGACGGALSHRFGRPIEQQKIKTIK